MTKEDMIKIDICSFCYNCFESINLTIP